VHHRLPWLLLTIVALLVVVAMAAPIRVVAVAAPLVVDPLAMTGYTANNYWRRFDEDYVPQQHTAAVISSSSTNQP
jgi:hypothetical protein